MDKCYGNIINAYKAHRKAGLGLSDHNMVHLIPEYKQKLKQENPIIKRVRNWTKESIETLQGCFDSTDWDVFNSSNKLSNATEAISDYIRFCEGVVIPEREVTVYPNSKPWITKDIRELLRQKQCAFLNNEQDRKRRLHTEINKHIRHSKWQFGEKIKHNFKCGDPRKAWQGMQTVTGCCKKQAVHFPAGVHPMDFANDLNQFYTRFDIHDFSKELNTMRETLSDNVNDTHNIQLSVSTVEKLFRTVKTNKALGPDRVSGKILKFCSKQLAPVFHNLFEWSLNCCTVPIIWKTSTITPVSKVSKPCILNDYRPVALTSIAMKCFEHIVRELLVEQTQLFTDPFQFAYCSKRGVEDAVVTMLHKIYEHLDKPRSYVRTLFIDFSSAFNTMQPHALISKLHNMNINPYLSLWISDFFVEQVTES